jgi:O-glycosyl hydrolase
MTHFSLSRAANTLHVLSDVLGINKAARVHLVPWSPPAWMKSGGRMAGGALASTHTSAYALYLAKAVQGFAAALGAAPYAVAIQNEPQNGDGTYPTNTMSVDAMGAVGKQLHGLLAQSGHGGVKIIGFEVLACRYLL